MPLTEYPLAETAALEDGRTVEWEAVGGGPPLMWVEGGPGLWAHLARPDVQLVSDVFRCHLAGGELPFRLSQAHLTVVTLTNT